MEVVFWLMVALVLLGFGVAAYFAVKYSQTEDHGLIKMKEDAMNALPILHENGYPIFEDLCHSVIVGKRGAVFAAVHSLLKLFRNPKLLLAHLKESFSVQLKAHMADPSLRPEVVKAVEDWKASQPAGGASAGVLTVQHLYAAAPAAPPAPVAPAPVAPAVQLSPSIAAAVAQAAPVAQVAHV